MTPTVEKPIRLSEILALAQIDRHTLGGWVKQGLFPTPSAVIGRTRFWRRAEVYAALGINKPVEGTANAK